MTPDYDYVRRSYAAAMASTGTELPEERHLAVFDQVMAEVDRQTKAEVDRLTAEVNRLAGLKARAQIDRDQARDEVDLLQGIIDRVGQLTDPTHRDYAPYAVQIWGEDEDSEEPVETILAVDMDRLRDRLQS